MEKGVKNDFPIRTSVTFTLCIIIYCSFIVTPLCRCYAFLSRKWKIIFIGEKEEKLFHTTG